MKYRCLAWVCILSLGCSTSALAARTPAPSAASAILVDGETGRVLFEKDPHEKRPIASITKLMTALVAVESFPDLSQRVSIKQEWTGAEGSSMYLTAGEELTMESLLYGLLLASGNDAAVAVAGACAGDVETFVEWMDQRAVSLGMEDTHFSDPNGLSDEAHYSTAYDMSLLAMECLRYPQLMEIMGTKSISVEGRSLTNHNKLLWQYEGCIGMKTGYTRKAGRTLVSAAQRDGQTLICVTLSDPDDWADHAALLDHGFKNFPKHVLARAGKSCQTLPVSGSLVRTVAVEISHDVYYPLTAEEQVRAVIDLPESVEAPVEAGTVAGSLSFWVGEEEIGRTYLLYSASVRRDGAGSGSLLERALEYLRGESTTFLSVFYPIHAARPRTYGGRSLWKSVCKKYFPRQGSAPVGRRSRCWRPEESRSMAGSLVWVKKPMEIKTISAWMAALSAG